MIELDAKELKSRIVRFQKHLTSQGLGGAIFLQLADRYYFTGTIQSGYVVIPAEGEILVLARKDVKRATAESPLEVTELKSLRDLGEHIKGAYGEIPSPLGVEMDVLPVTQMNRLAKLLPGIEFKDVSKALMLTRAIKTEYEVERISMAAEMVRRAVEMVPSMLRPGMPEIELAAAVEYEMRRIGHGGFTPMRAFNQQLHYGHIFAGADAAEPGGFDMPTCGKGLSAAVGQGAGLRSIGVGEPVVVDVVGHFEGYLCDQTRIFSMGPVAEPFGDVFKVAREIQDEVIQAAKPGVKASELYNISLDVAKRSPYGDYYLGETNPVSFVGHGIGLEIDEFPFLARGFDLELEEGMVFALEPKFSFIGKGAVGIEDTYVVRADGVEQLTKSPKELIEVSDR